MTSASTDGLSKKYGGKSLSNEEIVAGFQKLRSEQRFITQKLAEMEMDQHEHKIVIDALKDLDSSRKCFRMIGGILCERTVGDVLPALKTNEEQLGKVIESLNKQLVAKGVELNTYKDEHNVKIKKLEDISEVAENESQRAPAAGGVLVQ